MCPRRTPRRCATTASSRHRRHTFTTPTPVSTVRTGAGLLHQPPQARVTRVPASFPPCVPASFSYGSTPRPSPLSTPRHAAAPRRRRSSTSASPPPFGHIIARPDHLDAPLDRRLPIPVRHRLCASSHLAAHASLVVDGAGAVDLAQRLSSARAPTPYAAKRATAIAPDLDALNTPPSPPRNKGMAVPAILFFSFTI